MCVIVLLVLLWSANLNLKHFNENTIIWFSKKQSDEKFDQIHNVFP